MGKKKHKKRLNNLLLLRWGKERPVGMHQDMDVLGRVGTSKRIGSSVLHELDSRAGEKLGELKTNQGSLPTPTATLAQQFQDAHTSQFNKMDSLDSHYACIPHTPKRHSETDAGRLDSYHNNNINGNTNKKLKIPLSPPVNEITRRIRRLRLRGSLTGGNGNSNQSRTPSQAAVKNTTLTKQRPMDPPRFLRPTINSLNKHKEVKDHDKPRTNLHSGASASTSGNSCSGTAATPAPSKPKSSIPRSQSVFQRLYTQTTISRSCSMGNVSVKGHPVSQPVASQHLASKSSASTGQRGLSNGHAQHTTASNHGHIQRAEPGSRFSVTRSKTSGSLSSHLDRPAWR